MWFATPMDTGLHGRTVIITGATANIGRAAALAFAAEGAQVVVCGRDADAGARVVAEAMAAGAKDAVFLAADVTDRAQVDALVAAVLERYASIDVLVNNVGGNVDFAEFVDSDPASWDADIELTFKTTLRVTHTVLPHMISAGGGRIVNVGSMAGVVGDKLMAVYSASKGAVHAFTTILAKEVAQHGITVNAVAPYGTIPTDPSHTSSGSRWKPGGLIQTGLTELGDKMKIGRATLLNRMARPEEVASAIVYLASDGASYITGEILHIDGGTRIA